MDVAKKTREYVKHIVTIARVLTRGISREKEYRYFIKTNIEREWAKFRSGEKTPEQIQRNAEDIFYTVFPELRMNKVIPSFKEFSSPEEEEHHNSDEESIERRTDRHRGHTETASVEDHDDKIERPEKRKRLDADVITQADTQDDEHDVGHENTSVADQGSEVQGTLKESLLREIIGSAIKHSGLSSFNEDALAFIDSAVRIRLRNMLTDLKRFLHIRLKNQELYLLKHEANRVNTLLKIDREVEEVRLLCLRDQRLASRRLTERESRRTMVEPGVKQGETSLHLGQERLQVLKLNKMRTFQKGRRAYLQSHVDHRLAQRRRKRNRSAALSDINVVKKEYKKENITGDMDMKEKLLQLPRLIPPTQPLRLQKSASGNKFAKPSFYSNNSITLFDCDLLMEFDPQLRKSDLRFKRISRVFDIP